MKRPINYATDLPSGEYGKYCDDWPRVRCEAWHATFNAALQGLLANTHTSGPLEDVLHAASDAAARCADLSHGEIPRVDA